MIRYIVNYIKTLKCEHEWRIERYRSVTEFSERTIELWICKHCGYNHKIKY